ncbi:MAG: DEAD/DEAH box helicase family protein [Candidatus Woesearchaeota archaeon]
MKNIQIKDTYWSGEDNIINDFYIPCLKESVQYDRAAGYFSSSILKYITEGIFYFIDNNGKMRLICSPKLSPEDKKQIKEGYEARNILNESLNREIKKLINDRNNPNVSNLFWLIKNDRLDIKICLKQTSDIHENIIFHEKFGVFIDEKKNAISFMGSINESLRGWIYNEESFEVSLNWLDILEARVNNKIERFNKLWNGAAKNINTYKFPEALKKKIINEAPDEPVRELTAKYNINTSFETIKENEFNFVPRKCQTEAYNKFYDSDYKCLFQMATGSGKTMAALYSFQEIEGWKFLLILVPTIELVEQWEKDVKLFFPESHVIKCSSDNPKWKENLIDIIQANFPFKTVVISTYSSAKDDFGYSKWQEVSDDISGIICDEAHNLGGSKTQRIMNLNPEYRIGLSATPQRNFDEIGTKKILNFFNNNVYKFSIKEAIRAGYLVEYYYNVYPVFLTEFEWDKYKKLTKQILKLQYLKEEEKKEDDILQRKYRKRAKLIKTAENKTYVFNNIIEDIPDDNRILIYGNSKRHLQRFAEILDSMGKEYFIYTGNKNSKKERPVMLEQFKLGTRKILLAINCLDEGIDIPVCDSAVFISSSTSKRQFIQRRGRVLRKSIGKNRAYIYDYIVIPEIEQNNQEEIRIAKQIIQKEYDRINIVADDAINGERVKQKLDKILDTYGLNPYSF